MPSTTVSPISFRAIAQASINNKLSSNQNNKRKGGNHFRMMGPMKAVAIVACSLCLIACLLPIRPVQCGRLQDFIQNLVGGGNSNSNSNNNSNNNANSQSSNSNSNNDSNDSDTAATGEANDQPMTPMMSAMNPFMRYPSF